MHANSEEVAKKGLPEEKNNIKKKADCMQPTLKINGLNVYGSRLGGREDKRERHQQRKRGTPTFQLI